MDFDLRVPMQQVLGPGRPPGRYHFVAVVQTATQRVFLSAGEATLGR